jgi:hypothetical protein
LRLFAALLLMFPAQVIPGQLNPQWMEWWQSGVFGYCTKTDIAELGSCGTLELREIDWGK